MFCLSSFTKLLALVDFQHVLVFSQIIQSSNGLARHADSNDLARHADSNDLARHADSNGLQCSS